MVRNHSMYIILQTESVVRNLTFFILVIHFMKNIKNYLGGLSDEWN